MGYIKSKTKSNPFKTNSLLNIFILYKNFLANLLRDYLLY